MSTSIISSSEQWGLFKQKQNKIINDIENELSVDIDDRDKYLNSPFIQIKISGNSATLLQAKEELIIAFEKSKQHKSSTQKFQSSSDMLVGTVTWKAYKQEYIELAQQNDMQLTISPRSTAEFTFVQIKGGVNVRSDTVHCVRDLIIQKIESTGNPKLNHVPTSDTSCLSIASRKEKAKDALKRTGHFSRSLDNDKYVTTTYDDVHSWNKTTTPNIWQENQTDGKTQTGTGSKEQQNVDTTIIGSSIMNKVCFVGPLTTTAKYTTSGNYGKPEARNSPRALTNSIDQEQVNRGQGRKILPNNSRLLGPSNKNIPNCHTNEVYNQTKRADSETGHVHSDFEPRKVDEARFRRVNEKAYQKFKEHYGDQVQILYPGQGDSKMLGINILDEKDENLRSEITRCVTEMYESYKIAMNSC